MSFSCVRSFPPAAARSEISFPLILSPAGFGSFTPPFFRFPVHLGRLISAPPPSL